MNYNWRRIFSIGLVFVTVFALLSVSLAGTLVPAKPGGGGGKPPGEEPPADPAIAFNPGSGWNKIFVMNEDGSNQAVVFEGDAYPPISWSPDGASIAFRGTSYELWRVDVVVVDGVPTGTNAYMIAAGDACGGTHCYDPAWSPAGDVIAVAEPNPEAVGGLWLVPATGGTPTKIYSSPGPGYTVRDPTWRSDSTQIAFMERSGTIYTNSIRVMDIATGDVTTVLEPVEGKYFNFPDWARTDDILAYTVFTPPSSVGEIYTLNLTTGATVKVVDGRGSTFSPDDGKLAYWTGTKGRCKTTVYAYDFVTEESEKLACGVWPDWKR